MPENDYIGRILETRYKVFRRLGESGMGVVYLGENIENGTLVAVKFLRSEFAGQQDSIRRFFREARATVQLRHKNIIKVYDIGVTDEGEPYLVTEYLEGESLSNLLSRVGKVDTIASIAIIEPIIRAVGSMHKKGILHRGIKPENIFLARRPDSPPRVKLTDLGLSKFTEKRESKDLTVAGVTLGDILYISPEQIKDSRRVDKRADLYSIATIMYEMLTGKLPFGDLPDNERLVAKFTSSPASPRQIVPSIPPALDALIMSALKKEVDERPSSAEDMLATIERLKGFKKRASKLGRVTAAPPRLTIAGGNFAVTSSVRRKVAAPSRSEPPEKETTKKISIKTAWHWLAGTTHGRMAGAAAVALLILVVLLIVFLTPDGTPEPPPAHTPPQVQVAPSPLPSAIDEKPTEVQIEVRGLPQGAKIYYDDALIPRNPFRVALKEVIVPLKIEADGYEAYATSVVPAEDQVVKIEMKRAAPSPEPNENEADDNSQEELSAEMLQEQMAADQEDQGAGAKKQPADKQNKKPHKRPKGKDGDEFLKLKHGVKVSGEFE
jgi:serine/threonine protein kinase